jgi:hypothetical protein
MMDILCLILLNLYLVILSLFTFLNEGIRSLKLYNSQDDKINEWGHRFAQTPVLLFPEKLPCIILI